MRRRQFQTNDNFILALKVYQICVSLKMQISSLSLNINSFTFTKSILTSGTRLISWFSDTLITQHWDWSVQIWYLPLTKAPSFGFFHPFPFVVICLMMDPSFFNDKSSPKIQGIHLSECVKIFYGFKFSALVGLARETKTKLFDLCLSFQKITSK